MSTTIKKRRPKLTLARFLTGLVTHFWLIFMVTICLLPVVWMVSAAFTAGRSHKVVPIIPDFSKFSFEHFKFIFSYTYSFSFIHSMSVQCLFLITKAFFCLHL